MFKNRIKDLQKRLKKNNIFAYLELDEANKFYLTGFKQNPYPILFVDNKIYFFTCKMLFSQANEIFVQNDIKVETILVNSTFIDEIKALKLEHKILDLHLNLSTIKFDFYNKLNNFFELKNGESKNIVEEMRMIKDEFEIGKIKTACKFSRKIASKIPDLLSSNITELELAKKIDLEIIEKSGEKAFDTIVAFGANSSYPHHFPGDKKHKKGETVLVDFGAKYENYCSDVTRTFFADNDIYKKVDEVQKNIINLVKPGITAREIDDKTRSFFKKHKLEDYFLHSTGHGVGLEIHESPAIAKIDDTIIKKNMVITIEPGIYIEKVGGVRIEDTILVTEKGCEVLT